MLAFIVRVFFVLQIGSNNILDSCLDEFKENIRESEKWNNEVLEHLRRVTTYLSKTVDAFHLFQESDLGYFSLESKRKYFPIIKKRFCRLKHYQTRFEELEALVVANSEKASHSLETPRGVF